MIEILVTAAIIASVVLSMYCFVRCQIAFMLRNNEMPPVFVAGVDDDINNASTDIECSTSRASECSIDHSYESGAPGTQ
jgi:hypothetical protein